MTFHDAETQRQCVRRYPALYQPSGIGGPSPAAPRCVEQLRLDICRALHLWPSEVCLESDKGVTRVVTRIDQALRRQRGHAISGHWSYDLSVHARLLELHRLARNVVHGPPGGSRPNEPWRGNQ